MKLQQVKRNVMAQKKGSGRGKGKGKGAAAVKARSDFRRGKGKGKGEAAKEGAATGNSPKSRIEVTESPVKPRGSVGENPFDHEGQDMAVPDMLVEETELPIADAAPEPAAVVDEPTYGEIQKELIPVAHDIITENGGLMPLGRLNTYEQIRELVALLPGDKKPKLSSLFADCTDYLMLLRDDNNQMQIANAEGFDQGKVRMLPSGEVVLVGSGKPEKKTQGALNLPKIPGIAKIRAKQAAKGEGKKQAGNVVRQAGKAVQGQQAAGKGEGKKASKAAKKGRGKGGNEIQPVQKALTKNEKLKQKRERSGLTKQEQKEQNMLKREERIAKNKAKTEERIKECVAAGTDPDICWDFVGGTCRRGDKCKWKHICAP